MGEGLARCVAGVEVPGWEGVDDALVVEADGVGLCLGVGGGEKSDEEVQHEHEEHGEEDLAHDASRLHSVEGEVTKEPPRELGELEVSLKRSRR